MRLYAVSARLLAVATALALVSSCSARDNSASRPAPGQKPGSGPVGGAGVELSARCKQGDGVIACSRVVSVASQTVDVPAAGDRVDPATVDFDGSRARYSARLAYRGPAEEALDSLEAGLLQNGWRQVSRRGRDAAYVGTLDGPFANHEIRVTVQGDGVSEVIAEVVVFAPA